jgi:hypothetical protein
MAQHAGNIQIPSSVPGKERAQAHRTLGFMQSERASHDNATSLAEDAAHNALDTDHDEWLDDEQHWVWELALLVIPTE